MIPRVMHRYWVGGEIPSHQQEWIARWAELHPEWEQVMWGDATVVQLLDSVDPMLVDTYYSAVNPAMKSDLARFHILLKHGGVYMDTDFRPIKPIDELLHGCNSFVVIARRGAGTGSGVIGCAAGHPFMQKMVEEHAKRFNPQDQLATGPPMVDAVRRSRSDVRVLEQQLFFPIEFSNREQLSLTEDYSGAYAVHHFAYSWKSE